MKKVRPVIASVLVLVSLFGLAVLSSCSSVIAQNGDTVKVDYTLSLPDGIVYETSVGGQPLEFVLGKGSMISDFEAAIIGMKEKETKTITIAAANAYGEYQEDLIITIKRSQIQGGENVKVGDYLTMSTGGGYISQVQVIAASNEDVTIDANHPLAGKDLTFKIDLLKIN
ncbi:MAG: peptidylprolyl isomerase [Dehalococcoidales bacterium]